MKKSLLALCFGLVALVGCSNNVKPVIIHKTLAEEISNNTIDYDSILDSTYFNVDFKRGDGTNYTNSQITAIEQNLVLTYQNNNLYVSYINNNNVGYSLVRQYGLILVDFWVNLQVLDSQNVGGQKLSYRCISENNTIISSIYYADYLISLTTQHGDGEEIMSGNGINNKLLVDNIMITIDNGDTAGKYIQYNFDTPYIINASTYNSKLVYYCMTYVNDYPYQGIYQSDTDLNNMYNNGYSVGYNQGKADGKQETINTDYQGKTYQQIYNTGFSDGETTAGGSGALIPSLFGAIVNIPISVLNGLVPLTFFDISIIRVALTFLALGVVMWVIRKVMI